MKENSGTYEKQDYPRERIHKQGVAQLSNAELIAAIIGTGSSQKSVLSLSSDVIEYLPAGLKSLAELSIDELVKIDGIGNGKACQIIASVELGKRVYHGSQEKMTKITNPADVSALMMADLRYKKQEHFVVLILDTKNQVTAIETITIGTLNASLVHPREVFCRAIRKSANGIILVHNHPSGDPEPSREDLQLTERLTESGKIIGISILDHVVLGDGKYYSFKEHGLL